MIWEKAGLVAQLDRAPRYGRGGLGFDSLQGHKQEKLPFWEAFLLHITAQARNRTAHLPKLVSRS